MFLAGIASDDGRAGRGAVGVKPLGRCLSRQCMV